MPSIEFYRDQEQRGHSALPIFLLLLAFALSSGILPGSEDPFLLSLSG